MGLQATSEDVRAAIEELEAVALNLAGNGRVARAQMLGRVIADLRKVA